MDILSSEVISVLATFIIGVFGWFTAHCFGNQILEFRRLRKEIQEELIYAQNIWSHPLEEEIFSPKARSSYDKIRRLASELDAFDNSLTCLSRFWLTKIRKFNLSAAIDTLFAYEAAGYAKDFRERSNHRQKIAKSLGLPYIVKRDNETNSHQQ